MSAAKKSPASERRVKAVPAVPECKPTPRERLIEAASWSADYLYLDAIEEINAVLRVAFDVIDSANAAGRMTSAEHGMHAARAGGSASQAIDHLMTLREGGRDMSTLLRSIAEELTAESEAAQ